MVIIGDSRTEDLHAAVGDEGCIWAHKVGEGLYWMRDVAVPEVDDYIGSNSAVVILMGVNDAGYTGTAYDYVSYINARAADWAARGAVTYYFSVCPINEDIYRGNDVTNADIIAWNDIMRSGLSSDVIYVDVYDDIMEVMDTPDGMHYQRSTSTRWFELIKEAVAGSPSDPGVLVMPELTYDRVNVWVDTRNGKLHYDENGELDIGLTEIDGDWYYFNNFGYMVTGLVDMNGQVSMFDEEGKRLSGLVEEGGRLRYFDQDGVMQTGLVEDQGTRYYFDKNGIGASQIVQIDGKSYAFKDGKIQNGLLLVDGELYYCKDDGEIVTGWMDIDGDTYYFEKDGAIRNGWKSLRSGDDKGLYYFDENGKMATGWKTIEDETYYFDEDGRQSTGWVTEGDEKYYYSGDPIAVKVRGLVNIDGVNYYFADDGDHELLTGWIDGNGSRYYASEDGSLVTGLRFDIDNDIYLFSPDGILMWSCTRELALFIGAMIVGAILVAAVIIRLIVKGKHKK
jgi:glucan-binding repeat-containing protein